MNVNIENLPECRVQIALQFDEKDVQAAFAKVYKDLNRQGQVPGFRPGKTPKALLVRHYGEDAIAGMAKYELLADAVEDAVKDMDLVEPPELPDPEEFQVTEGQPLEVVLNATVGPRVTIGDLSGIEVLKPAVAASEEDVEKVIEELREAHGEEVKPDRDVVATGDVVDLEMEISLEGEADPVGEFEETVRVGAGDYFPPIDDKLIGRIVGQSIEMDATYPADYHDEELAGRSAHIKARIVALRELRLPPVDDDFARKVDEDFDDVDDLRSAIQRDIERGNAVFSREQVEDQVIEALLGRCEVDLPRALVLDAIRREHEELARDLNDSEGGLESLKELLETDDKQLATQVAVRVHTALTVQAIVTELAKQHGIEIGEEDLEAQAEIYASESALELSQVKQAAVVQADFNSRLVFQALRRRVFEAVMAGAQVREMPAAEYLEELRAQDEAAAQAAAEAAAAEQEAAEPGGEPEAAEGEDEERPAPVGVSSADTEEPSAEAPQADEEPAVHQSEDGS